MTKRRNMHRVAAQQQARARWRGSWLSTLADAPGGRRRTKRWRGRRAQRMQAGRIV